MKPRPTKLELAPPAGLRIEWSDGQRRLYTAGQLREDCPCATCREKRSADAPAPLLPVLKPEEARPLTITAMQPVGSYAYSITFSDGHDTGIYTLESLREMGREEHSA